MIFRTTRLSLSTLGCTAFAMVIAIVGSYWGPQGWFSQGLIPQAEARRRSPAARAFKKGTRLFKKRDFAAALTSFKRAYDLRPHFIVQCNIARCYERLSRYIESAEHYRRCLREGGARKRRFALRARKALANVKQKISWVSVKSDGPGKLFVDGRAFGSVPQRVALNPGAHRLEVRRGGHKPAAITITVKAGENREMTLLPTEIVEQPRIQKPDPVDEQPPVAPSEPERSGLHSAWFWTGTALTAALAVGATVLGVSALGAKSDYEKNPTREGYHDARDKRLLANVFWAATAAMAISTTTVFFFTDFGGGSNDDQREVRVGIGIRGTF
jgi:hypothetical protein